MKALSIFSITIASTAFMAACTAGEATPKLHPLEAACLSYEMTGQMQSGTVTRCHRKFGYEQYEIQNITIGVMGMTQTQNQHVITIGDTIYSIDLSTNTGTKTQNPMYESIVSAMEGKSPEEASAEFMTAMGMTATDQTKTIAGETCTVYQSAQMGTTCMTQTGLMLEQLIMGMGQVATAVTVGDGGEDANYTLYETVPITDGPDLSELPGLSDFQGVFGGNQ